MRLQGLRRLTSDRLRVVKGFQLALLPIARTWIYTRRRRRTLLLLLEMLFDREFIVSSQNERQLIDATGNI
jgi:hypothetical protein